jgi:hypothetical protein
MDLKMRAYHVAAEKPKKIPLESGPEANEIVSGYPQS